MPTQTFAFARWTESHAVTFGNGRVQSFNLALDDVMDVDVSRSSGRPVAFGDTVSGRHLMVVFDEIDADTAYPVTAYEVPRRQKR